MEQITIKAGIWPECYDLTIRVGDRVEHWDGKTGIVLSVARTKQPYILSDEVAIIDEIIVQADKGPRQRKAYPPARWDGIARVIEQ